MAGESTKLEGAFLAIGELVERLGVPTHVLRYWETRFPELKPIQRSGRRRYYRVEDVALATRIHDLLHLKGYTVDGARRALAGGPDTTSPPAIVRKAEDLLPPPAAPAFDLDALREVRARLASALAAA